MPEVRYLHNVTAWPAFSSAPITYALMEIKNERLTIRGLPVRVTHLYYTPRLDDKYNERYYLEPLKHPDLNAERNRRQYRVTKRKYRKRALKRRFGRLKAQI